jgi:hypothetical protein
MGFLKTLSNLFTPGAKPDEFGYWVVVKCNRCGEVLRSRIDLRNDPSAEYDEAGHSTYFVRKTLMGEGHCFQRVEVELTFDQDRRMVLNREIVGGQFVDE